MIKYFTNNLNEILILKIPNNLIDKNKMYYDLILFYELDNIKIKYKNIIISKNELKNLIYNNILFSNSIFPVFKFFELFFF